MTPHRVGSVWSVLGFEDASVVIVAGPFAAARGSPEYLVAPLYTGREPGFVWTAEDVRLEAKETGLGEPRFAAIWNARPLLESDLVFELGQLSEEATVAVRDAYWASLNDRPLGRSARLGRPIQSVDDPAAKFQAHELDRWQPLTGRVFSPSDVSSARTFLYIDQAWQLDLAQAMSLWEDIERSERLLGTPNLEAWGPSKASLTTRFFVTHGLFEVGPQTTLFINTVNEPMEFGSTVIWTAHWQPVAQPELKAEPRVSELALAA